LFYNYIVIHEKRYYIVWNTVIVKGNSSWFIDEKTWRVFVLWARSDS